MYDFQIFDFGNVLLFIFPLVIKAGGKKGNPVSPDSDVHISHKHTAILTFAFLNRCSIKHHTKLQLFFLFLTRGNSSCCSNHFDMILKGFLTSCQASQKPKKTISHVVWERRRRRSFSALDNIMEILSAMEGNVLELKLSTLLFFKVSIRRAKVLLCAASLCVEMNNV